MISSRRSVAERTNTNRENALRPPTSALRPLPNRVRSYMRPARSAVAPTWAGKPMPRGTGFPARGFGTGRTLRRPPSALRIRVHLGPSVVKHPDSAFRVFRGHSSAVRNERRLAEIGVSKLSFHSCHFSCFLWPIFGTVFAKIARIK